MHLSLEATHDAGGARSDRQRAAGTWKHRSAAMLMLAAVLTSCASLPEATIEQPDLTALVQPYAARLAALGVSRIEAPGARGGYISVGTPYGFFDIRDGADPAPAPFVVVSDDSARVLANDYTTADLSKYRAAIDRIVPEVLQAVPRNEAAMHELQTASH